MSAWYLSYAGNRYISCFFDFIKPSPPQQASTIFTFGLENVTPNYPSDVDVTVTLSPADGAVSAGKSCVATVKILSHREVPLVKTYKISFGYMTATWQEGYNYMGYNSLVNIRFSDGTTGFNLSQGFYDDDGKLVLFNNKAFSTLPKNSSETLKIFTDEMDDYFRSHTIREFLWDQNNIPIISEEERLPAPLGSWKLADKI